MKWCLKSVIVLLGMGLYGQSDLLRAQGSHLLSQKAADIEETDPAQISGQGSEDTYSRQNLCQIGADIDQPTGSPEQSSSSSNSIVFESANDRKINPGIPLDKVLGSLAQEGTDQPSQSVQTAPKSRDCE